MNEYEKMQAETCLMYLETAQQRLNTLPGFDGTKAKLQDTIKSTKFIIKSYD